MIAFGWSLRHGNVSRTWGHVFILLWRPWSPGQVVYYCGTGGIVMLNYKAGGSRVKQLYRVDSKMD